METPLRRFSFMHIELLTQGGVKITSKDKTIILSPAPGARGKADVVVLPKARDKTNLAPAGEKIFLIESPGEYEAAGIFFYCLPNQENGKIKSLLTSLETEEMAVAHLDGLGRPLNEAELELFEDTDILLLPVGEGGLEAKKASQQVAEIEPRVVIPLGGAKELFFKEMGVKAEPVNKIKISKKDLPQEGMRIFNLQA